MRQTERVADYENVPLPDLVEPVGALSAARAHYAARLDALDALGVSSEAFARAQAELAESVRAARLAGLSWADIGGALGLDRETARRRWPDPTRTHPE